jgi:hypothetical protein
MCALATIDARQLMLTTRRASGQRMKGNHAGLPPMTVWQEAGLGLRRASSGWDKDNN